MPDSQTPVRFAILGCGRMGRLHAERVLADGRGTIVALFDADAKIAAHLASELALKATVFERFDDLLAHAEADAAIICTPTALHFEQVQACRSQGWHVLCEKPLADQREHIVRLMSESCAGGPLLSVAYQRRYWPIYRVLREEVQSGRWGAVRSVLSFNCERWQQTIGGTWRDDPAINLGGFIGDAGSHKIDMAFFVTRLNPVNVFARNQTCGSHVEIVTSLSAQLERDVLLTMHFTGHSQTYREELHVHCEEADLLLRDWQLWIGRNNVLEPLPGAAPRWQGINPITTPDLDRLGNPVSGFLDQIQLGMPAASPPNCALPVFDFTQAVLRSGRSGRSEDVA